MKVRAKVPFEVPTTKLGAPNFVCRSMCSRRAWSEEAYTTHRTYRKQYGGKWDASVCLRPAQLHTQRQGRSENRVASLAQIVWNGSTLTSPKLYETWFGAKLENTGSASLERTGYYW